MWQLEEMTENTLMLQLMFEKPLFINYGDTPDRLKVTFVDQGQFISADTGFEIDQTSIIGRMKGQMPLGSTTESMMTATGKVDKGMQGAVIGNFVVNVLLSGSLQYLWGMINALQIVFHLPGNSVEMPANTKMIYGSLIKVTQFDLIPEDWLEYFYFWRNIGADKSSNSRRLSDEDESEDFSLEENYNVNLAEIGYESYLAVDNMQTLFVMIQGYVILTIVYLLFKLLKKLMHKLQRQGIIARTVVRSFNWLMAFLFWNVPFRFMLEGYLELAVGCFINLKPIILGE